MHSPWLSIDTFTNKVKWIIFQHFSGLRGVLVLRTAASAPKSVTRCAGQFEKEFRAQSRPSWLTTTTALQMEQPQQLRQSQVNPKNKTILTIFKWELHRFISILNTVEGYYGTQLRTLPEKVSFDRVTSFVCDIELFDGILEISFLMVYYSKQ